MINFNGKLINSSTEILSANNRAFKYGDALFETLKLQNSKINFLEDHYFRLMASMRMLRMEIPMDFTLEFFEEALLSTAEQNTIENARLRMTVFRKDGGFYNPSTYKTDFIIEAFPLTTEIKSTYTIDLYKDYFVSSGLLSTIKTTNKLTNVLASIYASENEFDNCILLNEKKQVVEAINGNIFLVNGTEIKTPPISEGCIKGIIRKKLIEIISKHKNFTIKETVISPFEIQKADEVFITNSIIEIQPVSVYKKSNFKSEVAEELILELNKLI